MLGDVENNVPDGKIDVIFLWGKPFSNLLQGNGVWEVPILDLLPNARKIIGYRTELTVNAMRKAMGTGASNRR